VERADLEESTVDEVLNILAAEFDQEVENESVEETADKPANESENADEATAVAPEAESVENEEQK
jgi:hypothetical protein